MTHGDIKITESETIGLSAVGGVATLTIRRPAARNALRPEDWQALLRAVTAVQSDSTVRVVVLRGEGGHFCAGGDLPTMPERLALGPVERRAQLLRDAEVIARLIELDKPVIAAIEGAAVGAGLALALACDVRIARADARLGAVFHRVGLSGDFGLSWLLPRAVGVARALELVLSAKLVTGQEAHAIGLVSRVVDEAGFEAAVADYACQLASGPTRAVAASKAALWGAGQRSLREQLALEAEAQAALSPTHDTQEGVAAFLAGRAPTFTGR